MSISEQADTMVTALLGQNTRRSGAWLYVQDAGDGTVSFVGGARTPEGPHPFRYGSCRTHQFVAGEMLLRPQLVIATDALTGTGLSGLAANGHDFNEMLSDGEVVFGQRDGWA